MIFGGYNQATSHKPKATSHKYVVCPKLPNDDKRRMTLLCRDGVRAFFCFESGRYGSV